jgi:hypothetical protein
MLPIPPLCLYGYEAFRVGVALLMSARAPGRGVRRARAGTLIMPLVAYRDVGWAIGFECEHVTSRQSVS